MLSTCHLILPTPAPFCRGITGALPAPRRLLRPAGRPAASACIRVPAAFGRRRRDALSAASPCGKRTDGLAGLRQQKFLRRSTFCDDRRKKWSWLFPALAGSRWVCRHEKALLPLSGYGKKRYTRNIYIHTVCGWRRH